MPHQHILYYIWLEPVLHAILRMNERTYVEYVFECVVSSFAATDSGTTACPSQLTWLPSVSVKAFVCNVYSNIIYFARKSRKMKRIKTQQRNNVHRTASCIIPCFVLFISFQKQIFICMWNSVFCNRKMPFWMACSLDTYTHPAIVLS